MDRKINTEQIFCSKLTEEQVKEIKLLKEIKTGYKVSKELNVRSQCIYNIWDNKTWKHIK